MFNRKAYKEIAKKQLKGRWMVPVMATLLYLFVMTLIQGSTIYDSANEIRNFASNPSDYITIDNSELNGGFSNSLYTHFEHKNFNPITDNPLFSLLTLFIVSAFTIALSYLYIIYSHTTEKQSFSVFIKGFSLWLKGFLGMLWMTLWIIIWSLLFIIPGIVKGFAYSQMFFILAEYPELGVNKAMKISKIITKGNKADLFVMCLSFIGWEILSMLTMGIGQLWLSPYVTMSFTNAYHAMKAHALQVGDVREEDFTK